MSNLDDLLDDLDELDDFDNDNNDNIEEKKIIENNNNDLKKEINNNNNNNNNNNHFYIHNNINNLTNINDLNNRIIIFRKKEKFIKHMNDIDNLTLNDINNLELINQLIMQSNHFIQEIDEEMTYIHRIIADIYRKKFPELESLIPDRMNYIKTINKINNEIDISKIDLSNILPASTIMAISMTNSKIIPLKKEELDLCLNGSNEIIKLEDLRLKLIQFVKSKMSIIAPNTCEIIGSHIAAHLMGLAGGLIELSKIPADHLEVVGQTKRSYSGYSSLTVRPHFGIISYCDLVSSAPKALQRKVLGIVSSKVALAIRIDISGSSKNGDEGKRLKRIIEDKIKKLQEPNKAQMNKALPIPFERPKGKRRGGKRVRNKKKHTAQTEISKELNRRSFGTMESEYGDEAMGNDFGRLGKASKRLRQLQESEYQLNNRKRKKLENKKKENKKRKVITGSKQLTSGLASTLTFTPVQGLELATPAAAEKNINDANNRWFNKNSGFRSAMPK